MTQKKKNLAAGISCGVLLLLCISVCLEVPEKIRDRNRITVGVFSDSYWNVQNGYSYRILNDAIQKFRERYPDVEVEYQYDEENPKADNQLDQALSTVQGEISESTQNR